MLKPQGNFSGLSRELPSPREPQCAYALLLDSAGALMPSLHGILVLPPNRQTRRASWIWFFRNSITQPQHSLFTLHAALADDDAKLASGDGQFFRVGLQFTH